MANIADVALELSGLLQRITDQRNDQPKHAVDEMQANALKDLDIIRRAVPAPIERVLPEEVLETLRHQGRLLDDLIARLHQEKPGKG